jgi:hypothetical protein
MHRSPGRVVRPKGLAAILLHARTRLPMFAAGLPVRRSELPEAPSRRPDASDSSRGGYGAGLSNGSYDLIRLLKHPEELVDTKITRQTCGLL